MSMFDPVPLLQTLIRFDTTNPPGAEAACIHYLAQLLDAAGLHTALLGITPERPNLIARLPGRGAAPPLLLYGHVDVVTTAHQQWTHPPFSGVIADGCVWGRGALDMKGGVAMLVSALLRARAQGESFAGDVLLALVCDEEHGGDMGARFLVEQHADLFAGVRYALSEFGGFPIYVGGQRFYAIGVAEKQPCPVRMLVRGLGGHGARPLRGSGPGIAGRVLARLDEARTPVRVVPFVRRMIETAAAALPEPSAGLLRDLLDPAASDAALDALGADGRLFAALLRNTASATVLRGGDALNVIPAQIELLLDGRLLPGCTPDDLFADLRGLLGAELAAQVEFSILDAAPGGAREGLTAGVREPDLTLFEPLADVLRAADPQGIPLPYMLSGVTDARFFNRLGIQTYGFLPMNLPPEFSFASLLHAADERIPVAALRFGADALYAALRAINR